MASENDTYYRRKAFEDARKGRKEYEYKLYVGHGDVGEVAEVVKHYTDNATLTPAKGLWKGETEASTVITILAPPTHDTEDCASFGLFCGDASARGLAAALRDRFDQDCILVTRTEVTSTLA